MRQMLRNCFGTFLGLTVLTGVLYPLAITGIAKLAFPRTSTGSLIFRNGTAVGSHLLGQAFSGPGYFWSRPSATLPQPYNGASSSGSNLGPTHPVLIEAAAARASAFRSIDPANPRPIPIDLLTTSGSGLDPHISPAAAEYQVERVARARGLPPASVRALVAGHTEGRTLGVLGEPRVNVLELNLALDAQR